MIVANVNYTAFKNVKVLLGAKFVVLIQDATADGGKFTAIANDGGSLAIKLVVDAKPADWDQSFGSVSVVVDSISL